MKHTIQWKSINKRPSNNRSEDQTVEHINTVIKENKTEERIEFGLNGIAAKSKNKRIYVIDNILCK